jgi:glycosyltransferase involved in cell wall biosynthesis
MCQFPFDLDHPLDVAAVTTLASYRLVFLNSEYTKRWYVELLDRSISYLLHPRLPDEATFSRNRLHPPLTAEVMSSLGKQMRALFTTEEAKLNGYGFSNNNSQPRFLNNKHLVVSTNMYTYYDFMYECIEQFPTLGRDLEAIKATVLKLRFPAVEIVYPAVEPVVASGTAASRNETAELQSVEQKEGRHVVNTTPMEFHTPSNQRRTGRSRCIVLIGRIFSGRQNKGHIAALRAIEELAEQRGNSTDTNNNDYTSANGPVDLHFVGQLQHGHEEHLQRLRNISQSPGRHAKVLFHVNAPNHVLQRVMESCEVQWHLTGLDSHPSDPASFEHFGISIVESMFAGLIPVVVRQGGGLEIVGDTREFGETISTIPALVAATRRILDLSPPDAQTMSERVRRRAMEYTRGRFLRRVDALMAGAMAGTLNHFVAKEQKLVSDLNGRKM